jgi:glucose-6-phosphate 1-dehydrogenase
MSLNEPDQSEERKPGDPASPCVMVIFGAAGDLTKRKLIPALYNLAKEKLLPPEFAIVGFARREMNDAQFREKISGEIPQYLTNSFDPQLWAQIVDRLYYVYGHFEDDQAYQRLQQRLVQIDQEHETRGNYLHYLATAPEYFSPVVQKLHQAGLTHEQNGQWRRVVIEKPFGCDLDSAKALNRDLAQFLEERQIYRIDHYLGKETVQNMVFRFSNGIFEPIWNPGSISITSRLPFRKISASNSGVATMKEQVRCGTWCPIIFFNSSRLRPWSRPFRLKQTRFATSKPRFCAPFSR